MIGFSFPEEAVPRLQYRHYLALCQNAPCCLLQSRSAVVFLWICFLRCDEAPEVHIARPTPGISCTQHYELCRRGGAFSAECRVGKCGLLHLLLLNPFNWSSTYLSRGAQPDRVAERSNQGTQGHLWSRQPHSDAGCEEVVPLTAHLEVHMPAKTKKGSQGKKNTIVGRGKKKRLREECLVLC